MLVTLLFGTIPAIVRQMNGHFRYSLRFIRHCHDIGQAVIKKMGMDLKLQLTQLRLVSELLFFIVDNTKSPIRDTI